MIKTTAQNLAAIALLLFNASAFAIDPDDVKTYDEVFRISARAVSSDLVEVSWDIEPNYYLYHNKFLGFSTTNTAVELGEALVPPGKKVFEPLLNEDVIKFKGRLTVSIPLTAPGISTIELKVRSQGCLEGELCYPPTYQFVTVEMPAFSLAVPASSLSEVFGDSQVDGQLGPIESAQPLQPEDAFIYEAIGLNAETILVRFTAQQGYYLYVDKFVFRIVGADGFEVRSVAMPEGTIKDDPEFGPVPVIYGQVEVPVRINRPAGPEQTITLEADYQGCLDGEICYPPQSMPVSFLMAGSTEAINLPVTYEPPVSEKQTASDYLPPVSEQDRLATLLVESPVTAIFAFFVAGLLLAFTPCVFPMVPILSGIIAGQGDKLTTGKAFTLSLVYVLAMAVTYTIAGVLAGMFGQNLQAAFQNPWIIGGFVAIFVALAFSMFGFYELQLPGRLQTALTEQSNRQSGGKLGGVAIMGFLSALIVGPCVAPPLAAALIVIGSSGSATLGGSALFALSMGMGVPLIMFGVSAGKLIPRAGAWMNAVKAVFGVGLLALAIWMLERIIPGPMILLLWGLLAIGSGVYMGALQSIPANASGWQKLWKALGLVLLIIGAAELAGAAAGSKNWLRPLDGIFAGAGSATEHHVAFQRIKSLDDLDAVLKQASNEGKPAMLDFYADWCVECIRMERNTFPDTGVQNLLAQIQPLQADVTPNDEIDQALMKEFGIIGPPAILFFDRNGNEMRAYRLIGYFKPEAFSSHLQAVLAAP